MTAADQGTRPAAPGPAARLIGRLDGKGPLFVQLKRTLARQILTGGVAVGDRLPSEEQIAAHYGVSRQTAHKAIAMLAREGFLVRRRKAGTFVAAQRQGGFVLPIPDIGDVVAGWGGLYEHRVLRREAARNGRNGLHWPDVAADAPLLVLECLHLGDGAPVQFERRWINLDAVPDAADEDFRDTPPGRWLAEHVPWSTARHVAKAVAASAEVAERLNVDRGTACLVVERRTMHLGQSVTLVHLTSVGERFVLSGTSEPTIMAELNEEGAS
ncbi:UTRA domain-containing protein [Azospirillum sp. sgz302134]